MKLASCTLDGRTGHDAGRALLAELYKEATGQLLPPIEIGEWGKPYFADSDWYFSISHTKNHAFCVLDRQNIAIDAEELDRRVSRKLAEKILSPMEKAQYDAAPDKTKALLTFWVLKEGLAKLGGRGLRGYPNDTAFSLDDPRVREMDGCLVAIVTEGETYAV